MGFIYKLDYEIDTTQSSPKSSQGERERERGGAAFFLMFFGLGEGGEGAYLLWWCEEEKRKLVALWESFRILFGTKIVN